MLNLSQETIIYQGIRKNPEWFNLTKATFFDNIDIKSLFKLDKAFYKKYNQFPSKRQLLEVIKNTPNLDFLTENKLDAIFDTDLTEYDDQWLKESIESWIEYSTLNLSLTDVIEYVRSTPMNADNVKEIVQTVKDTILERNNISLEYDSGLDFYNPADHVRLKHATFTTGYPYMDSTLNGGFQLKTLIVIAGQMKIGKSLWLINLAANAIRNGTNVVYITLEMGDKSVLTRLGANLLNVPIDKYAEFSKQPDKIKNRLSLIGSDNLVETPGQLIIKEFPTSSVGVPDIERYLKKLEEVRGVKFPLVCIDYLNLLQDWHNPHSEHTYLKIKRIAEDLRAMASRNNQCVLSLTQINKAGFDSNDVTISNIAESSGLGATVDGLYVIMQNSGQRLENKYVLKALLLRDSDGMETRKEFDVDYNYMRIVESLDSPVYTNQGFDNL